MNHSNYWIRQQSNERVRVQQNTFISKLIATGQEKNQHKTVTQKYTFIKTV